MIKLRSEPSSSKYGIMCMLLQAAHGAPQCICVQHRRWLTRELSKWPCLQRFARNSMTFHLYMYVCLCLRAKTTFSDAFSQELTKFYWNLRTILIVQFDSLMIFQTPIKWHGQMPFLNEEIPPHLGQYLCRRTYFTNNKRSAQRYRESFVLRWMKNASEPIIGEISLILIVRIPKFVTEPNNTCSQTIGQGQICQTLCIDKRD